MAVRCDRIVIIIINLAIKRTKVVNNYYTTNFHCNKRTVISPEQTTNDS